MICPICGIPFANFPKEDFIFSGDDCIPKNETAVKRREEVFESAEKELCLDCKENWLEVPPRFLNQIPLFRMWKDAV